MNIAIILIYEAIDFTKSGVLYKHARFYEGPKELAEAAARSDLNELIKHQCVTWYHILDPAEAEVIKV